MVLTVLAHLVAPHVGAWIETSSSAYRLCDYEVAPHVGAWIETFDLRKNEKHKGTSLPMWERGLKPSPSCARLAALRSLPMWERGLKPPYHHHCSHCDVSLPMWECGLKQDFRKVKPLLSINDGGFM